MYNLPYFKEKDQKVLMEFIHQHPFAFIAACSKDNEPVATQIPIFIEERDGKLFLSGHMMKNTDHHKALMHNPSVLCVFTGHHTYVSATWYSDPHQASTWNYMSVHAKGKIHFLGFDALVDILRKTSLHFENNNEHSTTAFDNLPEDYKAKLMTAIVAFEVEVESMDNVFKLSQNRDKKSYANIIGELKKGDADAQAVAGEMQKRESELFSDPS
jgi:transcriptional regulator